MCSGTQVRAEHERVVDRDDRPLNRALEDRFGVLHQIGIQGILAGDEDGGSVAAVAPGSADLLPKGGQGSGEPGGDDGVHPGNVDPQFEGVRARDAPQPAFVER